MEETAGVEGGRPAERGGGLGDNSVRISSCAAYGTAQQAESGGRGDTSS